MNPQTNPIRFVSVQDRWYPAPLREIPFAPAGIYIRGRMPPSGQTAIAVVGTRRATPEGLAIAAEFGRCLASAGAIVVSGLAFGVDAAAHRGCLDAGGTAIAVLPGGLNRCYPPAHEGLAEEILRRGGALISEYPPRTPALKHHFLERNRIVSGLSRGVVVIEAPERSGSLATARFALEQDRDIFVVPGPARHPHFAGSHALIRSGAELVTEPAHVIEALGIASITTSNIKSGPAPDRLPEERAVLHALQEAPGATIDKIISLTHLEAHTVNKAVAMLFVSEIIDEENGAYRIR